MPFGLYKLKLVRVTLAFCQNFFRQGGFANVAEYMVFAKILKVRGHLYSYTHE